MQSKPTYSNKSVKEVVDLIEEHYVVLPEGRVQNRIRGTYLKFHHDHKGYLRARMWCPGLSKNADKRIPMKLHRLVAMVYLKDFDFALEINHKNGKKDDNRRDNLEMVTSSQNATHAWNTLDSAKRREKVRKLMTGKVLSKETRQKISDSKKRLSPVAQR